MSESGLSSRPPRARSDIRRVLRLLHIWIGLVLCVPLAVIGVTGSILVYEHEIADLIAPAAAPAI